FASGASTTSAPSADAALLHCSRNAGGALSVTIFGVRRGSAGASEDEGTSSTSSTISCDDSGDFGSWNFGSFAVAFDGSSSVPADGDAATAALPCTAPDPFAAAAAIAAATIAGGMSGSVAFPPGSAGFGGFFTSPIP